MLFNACLSECFWAEVDSTTCYLVNQSLTIIDFKTPEKVLFGIPTNYSHLRVFGCPAYFHVNDNKFELRAKKAIFFLIMLVE